MDPHGKGESLQTQARALLRRREYFGALDRLRRARPEERNAATAMLEARALQGIGNRERALGLLLSAEVAAWPAEDQRERRSLVASTLKDEALVQGGARRRRALQRSLASYFHAWRASGGDYWPGINVATLAHVLGDAKLARLAAIDVVARAGSEAARTDAPQQAMWAEGTLAEGLLVLGRDAEAYDAYARVAATAHKARDWLQLGSLRKNARLVLERQPDRWASLDALLAVPPVVLCVGHIVDAPARPEPRLPVAALDALEQTLREELTGGRASMAVSGAAAGTDLLFQRAAHEEGVPTAVILPCEDRTWFLEASVRGRPGRPWETWWDEALARAETAFATTRHPFPDEGLLFAHANAVEDGYAALRAALLGTTVRRLAVWDGRPGDGPGGTASMVEDWLARHRPESVRVLHPLGLVRPPALQGLAQPTSQQAHRFSPGDRLVAALCFADVQGYSKLDEAGVLAFATDVLPAIEALLAPHAATTVDVNTWGDAVFAAFTDVAHAASFALSLADLFQAPPWSSERIGLRLGLRIALHAAPVHVVFDPLLRRARVAGAQISHAARIEPITQVGRIYASAPFASLLQTSRLGGVRTSYVGKLELAKDHGVFPTFLLERAPTSM